jgi:repressor LexA
VRARNTTSRRWSRPGRSAATPASARGIPLCQSRRTYLALAEARAAAVSEEDVLRLPVLGRGAAGTPIGADSLRGEVVLLDAASSSPAPNTC